MSRVVLALALVVLLPAVGRTQSSQSISLLANDLLYDATRQVIYASVPSSVPSRGNTITIINPATGAIGPSVFVGSEPGPLAISDNGAYLYVGLNGAPAVRRVDLQTFTATQQISLGSHPTFGPYYAEDLEVAPGQPLVLAVALKRLSVSPRHGGVAIFSDGVQLAATTADHTGSNAIEFSSTSARLYGMNTESTEFGFRRMDVGPGGVTEVDVTRDLVSSFNTDIVFDGGRIYTTAGPVIDAEARTVVGTFTGLGVFDRVRPVVRQGTVYYVTDGAIRAYDAQTFTPIGTPYTVPGVNGSPQALTGVGSTGLAFATSAGQVFLVTLTGAPPPPPPTTPSVGVTLTPTGCTSCAAGNVFAVSALVTNTAAVPIRVIVKAGFGLPDGSELAFSILGRRDFEVTLPARLNVPVELVRLALPTGAPRGSWTYEVTILSPELGRTYARSVVPFIVR